MLNQKFSALLTKWVSQIIDQEWLEKKLNSGKQLRIKFGIDPSGTILHIGHMVPILKLREFQELGHHVIILIGDATAQVGDSSDKDAERPMLAREETRKNAEAYVSKLAKILDISKIEIYYNSEWLDKVNFCGVGELAKHFSVAEMLDRHNFKKRFDAGIRISLQEFLYPIMQGYDSVVLKADVEIGGNDQYFNLLAGRTLQEAFGQDKQSVMTFDLLIGPDGKKMSKTSPNVIPIDMEPRAMFAKLMEMNDDLILNYATLATRLSMNEVNVLNDRLQSGEDPRAVKRDVTMAIMSIYHSPETIQEAQSYYDATIQGWVLPDIANLPRVEITEPTIGLLDLVRQANFFAKWSECRDAISWGSIKINGEIHDDISEIITIPKEGFILQSGKKKFVGVFLVS